MAKQLVNNIGSTYYIMIDVFSEPNRRGNLSRYYFGGTKGNRYVFCGTDLKKLFTNKTQVIKTAKKIMDKYQNAYVFVFEKPLNGIQRVIFGDNE